MTFHRASRTRRDLRSELDAIAGIGPRRRKALLTAFGSVAGVRRATREELVRVVGAKSADAVLAHFLDTVLGREAGVFPLVLLPAHPPAAAFDLTAILIAIVRDRDRGADDSRGGACMDRGSAG